ACLCLGWAAPAAAEDADMSAFDAACTNSTILLEIIGGSAEDAAPKRTELCACLVTALAPEISTDDAAVLAADLDGSATDESRSAYGRYEALSEVAGGAFDQCFAAIAPAE